MKRDDDLRRRVLLARDLVETEISSLILPEVNTDRGYTFLGYSKVLKAGCRKRFKDDRCFYYVESSEYDFAVSMLWLQEDKLTRFSDCHFGYYLNNKTREVLIGLAIDVNYMRQVSWMTYPIEEHVETCVFLYNLKFQYVDDKRYSREGYSIIGKELGRCKTDEKSSKFDCGSNYKNREVWDGFMTSYFDILSDSTKDKLWSPCNYMNYRKTNK